MDRRIFLCHVAKAVAISPICGTLAVRAALAADKPAGAALPPPPHWSYDGAGAPDKWGQLSPDYAACGTGREQSPVNFDQPIAALLDPPSPRWVAMPLEVVNTGHAIQVNCAKGSTLELDGVSYDLIQYHFHHPGEHRFNGVAFEMEVHFVHRAANGGLAVLGVMIARGGANDTLETIWRNLPARAGETAAPNLQLQPAGLLPKSSASFRYAGSLTTPPCSETVSWVVYRTPITASAEQIEAFAKLFPNNARPVQPLNRRKLLLDLL